MILALHCIFELVTAVTAHCHNLGQNELSLETNKLQSESLPCSCETPITY